MFVGPYMHVNAVDYDYLTGEPILTIGDFHIERNVGARKITT